MPDTLGSLPAEAKQFYERNLLFRARQAQTFYKFGMKTPLRENSGNSVSWRRFNALGMATTPLSEGVTPTASALSVSEITATVQEYGNYVSITDALDLLAIDKVMTEATDILGQNAGESIEVVIRNVIQSGTNVMYATGSTRGSQSAANPLTLNLLRKALINLDANNAKRFDGDNSTDKPGMGGYVAFVHPNVVFDIYNDTEMKSVLQQNSNNDGFWTGYIGSIYGVQVYQTTLAPLFAGAGAAGANVYGTLLVAQNAFGVVDVAGRGKYELIVKPLGSAGADDPLDQRGSIGWKGWQAPVILNNNFMVRIESGSTFG
jgi:N4-gp56 family major capsid protein